ncbi:DUF445 domain-containing protein [Ferriphaselus sp. R-1]|uniref:DUF445 domain-containing protein n=1 Tax=Ferriphaselus sp. R-1 TaxID=1485544 RepID=UPI000551C335|nr:DUF445 domain-containing protein [Ferriphaselus sp. R-1]
MPTLSQIEQLQRMKRFALYLLLAAAVLYALAMALHRFHPLFGYVAAFAEAAMVGAIADWFAVVALFRRPFGLPIPHTAIIPQNKQRIGNNLAAFICQHFLSTEQVLAKIREFDPAARLANWLATPQQAQLLGRLSADAARYSLIALEDSRVQHFIRDTAIARLEQVDFARASGEVLDLLTHDRRHQALLDEALRMLDELLASPHVQEQVSEAIAGELRSMNYLGGTLQRLGVDELGARYSTAKLVSGLSGLIADICRDTRHPLRERFDHYVADFVLRLKDDPDMHLKGEQIKAHLLHHPQLSDALSQAWHDLLDWLRDDLGREDSVLRTRVTATVQLLGEKLQGDEPMRAWINEQIMVAAPRWIEQYREDIRRYIAERVDAWDTGELVGALEHNIGRDLQFIRINGTLVGGSIGLLIYTVTQWLR